MSADIESLVETFDMNIESLKSAKNKAEAEIRKNYIDPMFESLGWNIRNTGLHEYEKEVVAEYPVKGELGTKKADYCFRLNGKDMFYVEAKDPYVNIETNQKAAFQIRSYCWSAKVPLGVLTDFEEFAVYDGAHEPKITDSTDTARTAYFSFKEYKDKWNEIAGVFSKEAVKNGSLDKYIKKAKRKKGIPVDETFLKDMENWREILAVNIASLNPELSRREINFAVQRTIDRIVFLRICEDRGTEAHGRIKRLSVKRNIYPGLVNLFREADTKYNSGIFCFAKEKGRTEGVDTLTPNLKMDDSVLKTVIGRLYYPSPYNFAVMPADILGQIYERFLGKVIEISPEREVSVEEKPEVRKAGGVYYTPTYIVNYIVENTIDKLIEGKTPAQVSKMRFLDPACGSGSFLIQAYQHLLNWHLAWYSENGIEKHTKGKRPVLAKDRKGSVRLSIDERKKILLNNIYGVDIDFQAVEVTKLSLLLKVLEGEDDLTMQQLGIFKERALPDLGKNIKCGNSLIGPDYYENVQMNLNDEDEILRVNVFDWNSEFAEIMGNGGFDAVIGNPPYIHQRGLIIKEEIDYYKTKFISSNFRQNTYTLFMEKGLNLLNKKGLFAYIVPNYFLSTDYDNDFREFLYTKHKTVSMFDVKNVFSEATVFCIIPIIAHGSFQKEIMYYERESDEERLSLTKSKKFMPSSENGYKIDFVKKHKNLKRLGDYFKTYMGVVPYRKNYGEPNQTEETIKKKKYNISEKKEDNDYKYYTASDISDFYNNPNTGFIRYGKNLAEPRNLSVFTGNRIVVQRIIKLSPPSLKTTIFKDVAICNSDLITIKPLEKKWEKFVDFSAGVISSKYFGFMLVQGNINLRRSVYPKINMKTLLNIDFPDLSKISDDIIKEMSTNVNNRIKLSLDMIKTNLPHLQTALQRQIESTDRQIDQLVYKLYDLTDEEIKTVEEQAA